MKTDSKIDLFKLHKTEYVTPRKPALIELKSASYLAISGHGAPGSALFTDSIGALYGAAFTIKMTRKFSGQQDYAVCKLEGQWWGETSPDLSLVPQAQWRWKLLIRTPDFITPAELEQAVAVLLKRGKGADVKRVELETLDEGLCVQMLHIGPYDMEYKSVGLMRSFAEAQKLKFHGRHHEIYLSDPRRVAPERLKTILREPVIPA